MLEAASISCSSSYMRSSARATSRSAALTCFSSSLVPPGRFFFSSLGAARVGEMDSSFTGRPLPERSRAAVNSR